MIVVFIMLLDLDVVEVLWFLVFCLDDYQFLGVLNGDLWLLWKYCFDIVKIVEVQGFCNIFCLFFY